MTNGTIFHIMELYSIMENFMFDNKNAIAVIAAEVLENTILERILTNSLPISSFTCSILVFRQGLIL